MQQWQGLAGKYTRRNFTAVLACQRFLLRLRRRKFIFDLQIASYVQSGKIAPSEWESVLKYLSNRARYAISSITLYELIAGIDGGDEGHFPENRDRPNILYEPARP